MQNEDKKLENTARPSGQVDNLVRWLKTTAYAHVKFSLLMLIGFTPLTLLMDYGMGLVLTRDYPPIIVIGFIFSVMFFALVYEYSTTKKDT